MDYFASQTEMTDTKNLLLTANPNSLTRSEKKTELTTNIQRGNT